MRLPVSKHMLVSLTLLGGVLTLAVTVGLANPGLVPAPIADGPTQTAESQDLRTQVTTPVPLREGSAGGDSGALNPADRTTRTAQPTTATATPSQPQTTRAPPTPNPNYTPAVTQASGGGYEDDDDDHEDEEYEDDGEEHEEHEDDDEDDEYEDDD